MTSFVRCLHSELTDLYIVGVFFYVVKYLTHPLTVCNLIIVGSFILIEGLHINFHKGLTTCEESAILSVSDRSTDMEVTE